MHASNMDKSEQLREIMKALSDDRRFYISDGLSTAHLSAVSGSMAVSTRISELRQNLRPFGKSIECKRIGGIYYYRLVDLAGEGA